MGGTESFFRYARERHSIYLRREDGEPRSRWTKDPMLNQFKFTNVFRELDRTTVWFRRNVRDRYAGNPNLLMATMVFRTLNRIESGEAMFNQLLLDTGKSAFDTWIANKCQDVGILKQAILAYCGKGPYVTGAYIVKTPEGMTKLDGALWIIDQFAKECRRAPAVLNTLRRFNEPVLNWEDVADNLEQGSVFDDHTKPTLCSVWEWFRSFPYQGDFTSYEIVSDLRHTYLLNYAPDVMTWANPGPGAMRGLNRVFGRELKKVIPKHEANAEMQMLLRHSRSSEYWPQFRVVAGDGEEVIDYCCRAADAAELPVMFGNLTDPWPEWEMRDVEHTLCEFDKYERARLGQGRPRSVYR